VNASTLRASTNRSVEDGFFVVESGVHTISLAWRGGDRTALWDAFSRDPLDPQTGRRARSRESANARIRTRVMRADFAGSRFVLSLPPRSLPVVYAETTLAVGVSGLDSGGTLASAADAVMAEASLRELGERLGIPLSGGPATVRRFDLAVDCEFFAWSDAHAFMDALRCVRLHRLTASHYDGSVVWRNASGIQFRAYDKGAERHLRGFDASDCLRTIRLERQCRPPRAKQVTSNQFTRAGLRPDGELEQFPHRVLVGCQARRSLDGCARAGLPLAPRPTGDWRSPGGGSL
jgi:hypothetical protein